MATDPSLAPRPSSPATTIFLVDDDASFLRATSRLLKASGFAVKTFASAAEFFSQRDQDAAGCLVTDLQMPGMNGLELQAALARTRNPLPILFLTGHGDIPSSVRAMRGGAEDFLVKTAPRAKLLDAIRRALARDAQERKTRAQRREVKERIGTLTEREREVFGHVIRGRLNKQIADDLRIAERTVKHHRKSITIKLGVPSVAELTRLAHQAGVFAEFAPTLPKGQ
jgi:two-component system response regulator FixJ